MTSSSRRKPRTTRPSTRSRSELIAGLVVVALCAAAGPAAEWRTFVREPDAILVRSAAVLGEDPAPDCIACGAVEPAAAEEGVEDATKRPCVSEAADCRDALAGLRKDALAGVDLDIRVGGRPGNDYPCECRLEGESFEPRKFASTTFTWKAAGYCHKPLYFEDWQLERYGHSHGPLVDPFLSAAHFFGTLPVLPYKAGVELPWECVYPLGYYRPGNCAPWTVPAVPISCRGAAVQAATVTGFLFVLP